MSEPKIYTKNYVNTDDTFTVSSGAAAISNIYDRDKVSQWGSSGANSDSTTVTIEVAFFEKTTAVSRTIDTLLLLNHNLAAFTVYYWDGTTYQSWATGTAAAAGANNLISLSSQTTSKVKLTMLTTNPSNAEKAIGEFILCALQLDIGLDPVSYKVQYRQKIKQITLGDGSLHQASVFWTANRSEKYEAKVNFENLPAATRDLLAAIKEAAQPFLWYPESITKPDDIFLVNWYAPYAWDYNSLYKGAGVNIGLDLREV